MLSLRNKSMYITAQMPWYTEESQEQEQHFVKTFNSDRRCQHTCHYANAHRINTAIHTFMSEKAHTQISRETNSSLCFHIVKVGINAVRGFKVSVSSLCEIEMCVYPGVSAQLLSSVRLDLYLLSLYLVALFPWLEAVKSMSGYSTVKE